MKLRNMMLTMVVALAGTSVALAQDPPAQPAPPAQEEKAAPQDVKTELKAEVKAEVKVKSITGTLSGIDAAKTSLEIKDAEGKTHTFSITAQTKFSKEGKDVALTDLKAGSTVVVEFNDEGGTAVAAKVTIEVK